MAAKQRHIQRVRQRILDKLQALEEQEQALITVVKDYVAKAKTRAGLVLDLEDTGPFLQQYNGVLQMLDGVYNTCELLTASAEDMAGNDGDDMFLDTFCIDARSVMGDTTMASPTQQCHESTQVEEPLEPKRARSPKVDDEAMKRELEEMLKKGPSSEAVTKTTIEDRKTRHAGDAGTQTALHKPPSDAGVTEISRNSSTDKRGDRSIFDGAGSKRSEATNKPNTQVTEPSQSEHTSSWTSPSVPTEVKEKFNRQLGISYESKADLFGSAVSVKDQTTFDREVVRASSPMLHSDVGKTLQVKDTQEREVDIDDMMSSEAATGTVVDFAPPAPPPQNTAIPVDPQPSDTVCTSRTVKQNNAVSTKDNVVISESKVTEQASLVPEQHDTHSTGAVANTGCEKLPSSQQSAHDDSVDQTCTADVTNRGYGKGPTIEQGSLLEGNITPVLITDITSPWCFYVQPYGPQLNSLMEEICLYMVRHGLSDVRLCDPTVSTVCLARYSKDNAFYRAVVTGTSKTGVTVTEVNVFFLDYGNRERVKVGQLRKMPELYARLPTQAICCALAEVVPNNKYNVWTEENIFTFQQFVFGQQLRCMPVCHSSNPAVPFIVRLTMNYPVPAAQGMMHANMAYLAEISVGKLLVSKGQAKDIAVADQVGLIIKSLEGTEDAIVFNGSSGKMLEIRELTDSQAKDLEGGQGHSNSSECNRQTKVDLDHTSNTDGDKHIESDKHTDSDTHTDSGKYMDSVIQNTDRQGRKHFCSKVAEIVEDPSDISAADNEKTLVIDSSITEKPVKDTDAVNDTVTVAIDGSVDAKGKRDADLSSPRSENSETESQGDVSKEVKGSKSSSVISVYKGSTALPGIVEELDVSEKSTDTGFMSADINLDLNQNMGHEVMLSYVKSPGDFYLHIVSRQVGQTLDRLMKNLNQHFEGLTGKRRTKLSKSFTCKVDKKCCARFSEDGHYYRAVIVSMDSPTDSGSSNRLVQVFYIDFGDGEWLPTNKLYPLPEQFVHIPPLAIHCSLAFVRPCPIEGVDGDGGHWPEKATEKMVSLTGFNKKLLMHVIHGTLCMDKNGEVLGDDSGPLQILLVDVAGSEEICINMEMIHEGEAELEFTHTAITQDGKITPDPESPDVPSMRKDWNPMAQDFFSMRNSYNIDVDDAGVATTGYKAQDETRICKYFSRGQSCWRAERCPYRHVRVHSGVTLDKEPVYCVDNNQQGALPAVHSWVALEVSTILSPAHFYAHLPLGCQSLDAITTQDPTPGQFGDVSSTETLDDLLGALNEEYGKKTLQAGSLILRAPGEIVVARFSRDNQWYRARVLCSTEDKVKVFYVDFGNSEWQSVREIQEMKPEFLHLPFQALECFLYKVQPSGDNKNSWSTEAKKYFSQLVDGKTLVGHVKSRWWNGVLWVELYDTSQDSDVNIAEALISRGFAEWTTNRTYSSCPSESDGSSAGSDIKMIPG